MGIGMRAKISIAFLSISLIASFGLSSNQAFAGAQLPHDCEDCIFLQDLFDSECPGPGEVTSLEHGFIGSCEELEAVLAECDQVCRAVGGVFEGVDTTSLLVTGSQMTASWMIPVIVSAIGIGIVIARKF